MAKHSGSMGSEFPGLPHGGCGLGQQLIQLGTAKKPAVEHDRLNAADIANVGHRIGVEEDQVRQLTDGDAAGLVLATQEPRRRDRRRLKCFHWR